MGIGTAAFWSKVHFSRYVFLLLRNLLLVVAWAVTFTLPYLYDPVGGAGLGMYIPLISSSDEMS
jgi:MFS transporter, SP family, sugar:H+ symporter